VAPDRAPEVRFSKAVVLHAQARNREETLNKNSKRIDELYTATVTLYKEIWDEDEGAEGTGGGETLGGGGGGGGGVDNFMIGVAVNYSMAVLNQARFRTINCMIFQPFPDMCLSILWECKERLHRFLETKTFSPAQEKPMQILKDQLAEVEKFDNVLRFKNRMEDIQKNLNAAYN